MPRGVTAAIILLCTIFLVVQATGAHEHLCMDGQEPAVSIHFDDAAELSGHLTEVRLDHHDLDIGLGLNSNSQLPKIDLPVLALLFAALFIAFDFRGKASFARARSLRFRYQSPAYFRPPLRGPPTPSVS